MRSCTYIASISPQYFFNYVIENFHARNWKKIQETGKSKKLLTIEQCSAANVPQFPNFAGWLRIIMSATLWTSICIDPRVGAKQSWKCTTRRSPLQWKHTYVTNLVDTMRHHLPPLAAIIAHRSSIAEASSTHAVHRDTDATTRDENRDGGINKTCCGCSCAY